MSDKQQEIEGVVAEFQRTFDNGSTVHVHEAARLILEARRERDLAREQARKWLHEAQQAVVKRDEARNQGRKAAQIRDTVVRNTDLKVAELTAERDAARKDAHHWKYSASKRLEELGLELDAKIKANKERDAALARVKEQTERYEANLREISEEYVRGHQLREDRIAELEARVKGFDERINRLKCQLECTWCAGAGQVEGETCVICEGGRALGAARERIAELEAERKGYYPGVAGDTICALEQRVKELEAERQGLYPKEALDLLRTEICKLEADLEFYHEANAKLAKLTYES